jgi:dTDP-4-amino-4,6-dideoxygalactose transaminase
LVDDRDKFISKMKSCGIGCSRVHDRNDKHPCLGGLGDLHGTDYVVDRMVSIPCGWWVGREDLEYIVSSVRSGW